MHEDFSHRLVVVADAARARIFRFHANRVPLESIDELTHADSRKRNRELVTGGSGSTHASAGHGEDQTQGSMSAHEHEAERFAVELADWMRTARTRDHVDDFVLICAPKFLGRLRGHMDAATRKCVSRTVNKDLAGHDQEHIEKAIDMQVPH